MGKGGCGSGDRGIFGRSQRLSLNRPAQENRAEVAAIRRGGFSIYDIDASTRLFPEDIVVLCATESEISAAEEILSKVSSRNFNEDALSGEIVLDTLEIKKGSFLDGKTLSEASMPGKYGVKVVDVLLSGGSEPSKPNPSEGLAPDRLLCMGARNPL
ncbi:MAG: hypothetical protein ACLUKN_00055 [Bacilli bacterium]